MSVRRILLCVPNVGRRPGNTHRLFTLALLYLRRACLRAGWDCVLLDAYFENLSLAQTRQRIAACGPFEVLGFTLNDDAMLREARALAQGQAGQPTVIAGGVYASRMATQILQDAPEIGHVFLGEAEATLETFLRGWADGILPGQGIATRSEGARRAVAITRGRKRLHEGSLDDLGDWSYDELPHPVAHDEYSLVTSRGCTARCNYCVIGPHWARYGLWRGHSARWIRDKLAELQRRGASTVNIVDDQFVGSPESIARAEELADLLAASDIRLPFVIMSRAETVLQAPQVFERMKRVGLRTVFLGLESGNDEVLATLRKDCSAAQGAEAVARLSAMGLDIASGTIVFHPWATLATVQADIDYFRALLDAHEGFEFYGLNELDLLHGTPASKLWGGEARTWHADWVCAEPAAQEVYRAWLRAQSRFLFPLLDRIGPGRARALRRHSCRWMLDALGSLLRARREDRLADAFMDIALSTQLLSLRAGVVDQAAEPAPRVLREDAESIAERCFN